MVNRGIVTRIVTSGAAAAGLILTAGQAAAVPQTPIEPGHYVLQTSFFGTIPSPETNVTVVGDQFQTDEEGVGPQNVFTHVITAVPGGAEVRFGADPGSRWGTHYELHRTPSGYAGTAFVTGQIPYGTVVLTRTERRANLPR